MKLFAISFLLFVSSTIGFAPPSRSPGVAFVTHRTANSYLTTSTSLEMSRIGNWIKNRRKKRKERREEKEIEAIREDFADDAIIIFGEIGVPDSMNLTEYLAAEEALFASFPDLTIDADEAEITDLEGDGVKVVDAVVSGTFTGEDYVYGDNPAVVATGAAISKETVYKLTVEDDLITKMIIIGGSPDYFYEAVAATPAEDVSAD